MRTPDDYRLPERSLEPEFETFVPTCPVCGAECSEVYTGYLHAVLGCDVCVSVKDAWEYAKKSRDEWRKLVRV